MSKKTLMLSEIGLAVLLAVIGLIFLNRNWVDFYAYYLAGQSFLAGRTDLYTPEFAGGGVMDYRYPPFFLWLFFPVWILPGSAAVYVWYWLNLASAYLLFSVIGRGLKQFAQTPIKIHLILLVSFAAVFKYFLMSVRYGNIHLLIVCLLFGAFYLLLNRKDKTAAFLMALAITVKIFPVFTLPYFFIKKKWRFLTITACFVIIFNLLPAFYFGFGTNLNLLRDWYQHIVVNSEFHDVQGPLSFSLKGQIQRSFTRIDYAARTADTPYHNVNLLSLEEMEITWLWKFAAVCVFLSALLIIWFSGRTKQDEFTETASGDSAFQEFGLMICTMLLVEPYTGTMYFSALLLPVAWLAYSAFTKDSRTGRINKFVLGFILFVNCVLPLIPGRDAQRFILILGFDFYATLFLWLALAYDLLRAKSRALNLNLSRYESDFTL